MQIIKVEIPAECGAGVCENCKKTKSVRPVESFGHTRESRGWFNLCFDCFGPQIFWRENDKGRTMMSPASSKGLQSDGGKAPAKYPLSDRKAGPVTLTGSRRRS